MGGRRGSVRRCRSSQLALASYVSRLECSVLDVSYSGSVRGLPATQFRYRSDVSSLVKVTAGVS